MPEDLLHRVSDTLGGARTVEELMRPLLEMLELVTGLESTYLTRIDTAAGVQFIMFSRNSRAMQIPEGLSVSWEDTLCKRALEEGKSFVDDVANCWSDSDAARDLGIVTYASTPVYLGDGTLYGTLCGASSERRALSEQGRQLLTLFSTLISKQLEREHLLDRLQRANAALETESSTDALTGLPNRRFALAELDRMFARAKRTGQLVLVAFIDLDDFKRINDTFGHHAGDAFLIEVGHRLSAGLRSGDVLGRVGGDEFIVVGLTAAGNDGEDPIAEASRSRLSALISGHYALSQCSFDYPGASIGVVVVDPFTSTPEEAVRVSDRRMYADKKVRRAKSSTRPAALH